MLGRLLACLGLVCVTSFGFARPALTASHKEQQQTSKQMVRYINRRLVSSHLASSPLRRELAGIVRAARENGVSPYFLLAIAGVESTFGKAACGHNAWGWNSCRSYNFASFAQGAQVVASSLRANYLDRGHWTLDSVAVIYCPPSSARWAEHVRYFMTQVFDAGEGLRWKDALWDTRKALRSRRT